jgi:hypothetical protein
MNSSLMGPNVLRKFSYSGLEGTNVCTVNNYFTCFRFFSPMCLLAFWATPGSYFYLFSSSNIYSDQIQERTMKGKDSW